MTAPLLSVVTVVRDDLAGLRATAASLRAQRPGLCEWLVADGGSRDGTAAWLAAHADATAWWRSAPDGGPYHGMNAGLAAARGRWVLFLNAGDTLAGPDTLGRLAAALAVQPDADFLYGDALERLADGRELRKPARALRWSFYGMVTHHQAMVYRRSLVGGLRYDTRFAIAADYGFTLRVLARAHRVVRLPFALCRFAPGGLSQRHPAAGRAEQRVIRREELGLGTAACLGIMAIQWAAQRVRRDARRLYEKFRFAQPDT